MNVVYVLHLIIVTKFIRTGAADKNDYPLFFEKSIYETDVDENEEINHTILTVTAKTPNESSNIRYKITSGNIGNVFGVHNTTGAIYIAGELDYEKLKKYELHLTAADNFKENYTTVVINVKDVNDNPPVFEKPSYRTQITEEDERGLPKRIMKVTASDADIDRPNNIIYFLTGPGIDPENPANSNFDINKATGEVFVLKPLNRDQPNGRPQWRFTVFAQDEGGEGLVGFTEIQIFLKDINDNAPVFTDGIYYGNITENGTVGMHVMTIKADDFDDPNEGSNAKIIYSIEKNAIEEETGIPLFDINRTTGEITTAVCCLDREKTPDYSLQIVATDGGGMKGTGTASIRVLDLNDMPPHFTKDEWFVEVEETDGTTLPETPILTVTVNDEDEVNDFQYNIIESSGYGADKFAMIKNNDGTGSLKIVQPLDFEDPMQMNGFRFRIQVKDGANVNDSDKNHVAHSWVIVKLKDINDNVPRFKRPQIETSVLENAEVGKVLGTFKAHDVDNGGKGKITYLINRATDRFRQFAINQDGMVSVQRSLDREVQPKHLLEILAIDDGSPPKTATAALSVVVKDVNDNAPSFAKNYRPVVMENSPPTKIAEIQAEDADDRLRGNGPPFQFRLDPNANDEIRSMFKVEQDPRGGNGDGMAIVSSLRTFDREESKEYHVPIVIKDSGMPPMTGTSTLTVVIGDINDNIMQTGSKEIYVYNYQGNSPDTPIGRVFVNDLDDWDLTDKKFYWDEQENPRFKLDEQTGMITIRRGAREGRYRLRVKVFDEPRSHEVLANVTIYVKHLSHEAIVNSGSVRLAGITDEEFIRIWDSKSQNIYKSKLDRFKDKLSEVLKVDRKNVDVFSVQLKSANPPVTDVRFSVHSTVYFKATRLNGAVLLFKEEFERDVDVQIMMVNINECLFENHPCNGSCTNRLDVIPIPYLVNANKTALVSIQVNATAVCACSAREFSRIDTCRTFPCYNNGRCAETKSGPVCSCSPGYSGARCQQTTRSFRGSGWAWYSPLESCDRSHLSLEFVTAKNDGLLVYNGPIVRPQNEDENSRVDFLAVELEGGLPRMLIDYGSGTVELKVPTKNSLADGKWHRLDLFWDTGEARMVVDFCQSAELTEVEEGQPPEFDDTTCQARGKLKAFNEYLNVNTPLQIGGLFRDKFDYTHPKWQYMPLGAAFDGCIKNVKYNGLLYDLAHPGLSKNSIPDCIQTDEICQMNPNLSKCLDHGDCVGGLVEAKCECHPGWTGHLCNIQTVPTTFRQQSYVKYALSFEPNRFSTNLQLRFRTREKSGELFRVSDQHTREYGILEIKNANLLFRYSLNSIQIDERDLSLSTISVDDGKWHVIKIERYGSAIFMELDGGEGRHYNGTFEFDGHQLLSIDKQEGIYAGGKAEFTGVKTFEVHNDLQSSCIDDIRLEGKNLPLPPAMNGTQWGQATLAKNIDRYCHSSNPCLNAYCPEPFECVDLWNKFECACGDGLTISPEGKSCVDRNECLDLPCLNGGTCVNQEPRLRYRCVCPDGFWGQHCEFMQERQALKFSTSALGAVIACLLLIIVLILLYFSCSKRRTPNLKKPVTKDDVRENIINYCDEGGGENDMTAFDMKPLKVPIGQLPELVQHKAVGARPDIAVVSNNLIIKSDVVVIEDRKRRADTDPSASPFDDLRNYAFEGRGSTSGSLSSLQSGTDDEPHDYKYLSAWGPRFDKLVHLYGDTPDIEDDAIS